MRLLKNLNYRVNLKDYTTFKIGGRAEYFFITPEVDSLYKIVKEFGESFYILGGGSNLLIKDGLLKKAVVKLGRGFSYVKRENYFWEVGGATPLSFLLKYSLEHNREGLDNLAGIPSATVGGLIMMNASSFGREVSSFLKEVEVMDREGRIERIEKKDISFEYRHCSLLSSKKIILRSWFEFPEKESIKEKIKFYLNKRWCSQPLPLSFKNTGSCGCIFKNPPSLSAGYLIEACGLKGFRKNKALVSFKHANFIINLGGASYNDVDYLINKIKDKVYKKFNIVLEEEIERWT